MFLLIDAYRDCGVVARVQLEESNKPAHKVVQLTGHVQTYKPVTKHVHHVSILQAVTLGRCTGVYADVRVCVKFALRCMHLSVCAYSLYVQVCMQIYLCVYTGARRDEEEGDG